MTARHRIIFGDARRLSSVGDESARLIVTSPPYWQLKDYGVPGQIGFDDTYEDYINNLNLVWLECERVLSPGCRLCVNIGDQFARSVYYGRYKVISIRTEIIRFCETVGFDFMGSIIWQKATTCNTTGGAVVMGSYPYPRNGIVKIDYESILLFKKHGKAPVVDKAAKDRSALSNAEWNTYFTGHWSFPGERQVGHLAMFPEELPRRLIRMFSFVGERVLDPFAGSATTTKVADELGRESIGIEINTEFEALMRKKLGPLAVSDRLTFEHPDLGDKPPDFSGLPYLYIDPLQLDKKVDPRENDFGSRIK